MLKLLRPTDPFSIYNAYGTTGEMYSSYHHGIDVRVRNVPDKAIKCVLGGKVNQTDRTTDYSWYTGGLPNENYDKGHPYGVHVRVVSEVDGVKYYTIYAHLDSTDLKTGDEIKAGDFIGTGGTTGKSIGDHLHLEIRRGADIYNDAFNPAPYFVDSLEAVIPEWGREAWDLAMEDKITSDKSVFDAQMTKGEYAVFRKRNNEFLLAKLGEMFEEFEQTLNEVDIERVG